MRRPIPGSSRLLAGLLFVLLGMYPASLPAKELVGCRYLTAEGLRIEIELTVNAPPPTTLIIMQNLPPGVTVTDSGPSVKKFSQKPGEAKWLMMGIRPGTTLLAFTLNKPVRAGELSGEMVYNAPDSGAMIRMPFTP